jgi:O-antigen/teichoic acid export membrane protein
MKQVEYDLRVEPESDLHGEIKIEEVKKKAVRGVAILAGRGIILNIIAQASQLILLAFLSVEQIGLFWIVSAAVAFFVYFSDIGLAAALIQKKTPVTKIDLRTTFTVQQILMGVIVIAFLFMSEGISSSYNLGREGEYLLYALAFSLVLASFKTIPSVLLERKLMFGKLVFPELIETLVYNVVVVSLAANGYGITSFTWAVVARAVVGLIAMYMVSPWRPGFALNKAAILELLRFGLPYQVNTFIALIKDQGITLLLGRSIGAAGVGLIGTSQKLSQLSLRLFMDPVTRVSFPAFARMQDDPKELASAVTRSILFLCFLTFPAVVAFWILIPVIIALVPSYERWLPIMGFYSFFVFSAMISSATTQLTNLLNAIGKIKVTSGFMVMWTILTIVFVGGLSSRYGVNGAAVGHAIVAGSSIFVIIYVKRIVNFSIAKSIIPPLFSTLIMATCMFTLRSLLPANPVNLFVMFLTGSVVYLSSSFIFIGPQLIEDAKKIIYQIIPKK